MKAILAGLLVSSAVQAQDSTDLTWIMPYYPPSSILVNGAPSNGITDLQVQYISANLPNVKTAFVFANPERVWYMLDKGTHTCFAAAIYNRERSGKYVYSITNIRVPQILVVRQDVQKTLILTKNGEVDLDALLANTELHGLIPHNRSYGEFIDQKISTRPAHSGLTISTQSNFGETILSMMAIGRSDYTIMHDYEFVYLQNLKKDELKSLKAMPIKGNNSISYSGVVCPKNAWGIDMVKQIDAVVGTKEGSAAMRFALEKWMTPESKIRYKKEFDSFFKLRENALDTSRLLD